MLSLLENLDSGLHWLCNGFSNVFYNIVHLPAVVDSAFSSVSSIFDYFPPDFVATLDIFLVVVLLLKCVKW